MGSGLQGYSVSRLCGSLLSSEMLCLPRISSEPQAFAGLLAVVFPAGIPLLSPQINTAQRLLEKGKEAPNPEPERSWFQTKEERKKEKSKLGRFLKKLNIGVPIVAQWLTNPTRNHKVAGSIPALAQWVNDPALP